MARITLIFFCLILLISCDEKESSLKQLKIAESYAEKGFYKKAIHVLDKLIENDPQNIDALLNRGFCNAELGRHQLAIFDYSKVLRLDQRNILALYSRALLYSSMGRKQIALRDLYQAIFIKEGGIVLKNQKNIDARSYDVSLKELRFERAVILYEVDELESAFSDLTFCIDEHFLPEETYYYRGVIYISYNNIDEGCKDLMAAKKNGNLDADTLIKQYCGGSVSD